MGSTSSAAAQMHVVGSGGAARVIFENAHNGHRREPDNVIDADLRGRIRKKAENVDTPVAND